MNNIKVEIYNEISDRWEDYSSYVAMPFKISELLDERLDEAEFQLQYTSQTIFEPLTKVKITILNEPNNNLTQNDYSALFDNCDFNLSDYESSFNYYKATIKKEILMLVANDKATVRPIGSGKYNHNLYLIEFTKFLEGFICDSLTFTNALGNNYAENPPFISFELLDNDNNSEGYFLNNIYRSVYGRNTEISLQTNVGDFFRNQMGSPGFLDNWLSAGAGVYITNSAGQNVYKQYFDVEASPTGIWQKIGNNPATFLGDIWDRDYVAQWKPYTLNIDEIGTFTITYDTGSVRNDWLAKSFFYVVENNFPVKKWTITDVICRILETIEPLRGFNTGASLPRFKLQGVWYYKDIDGIIRREYASNSLAEKLDKVLAPEFVLSKMTLREMLQQVGGFIHGEPRISGLIEQDFYDNSTVPVTTTKKQYYEIVFDEYGQTEKTYLADTNTAYITKEQSININDYCTSLDSSVDNLINALNYAQGVTVEPFNGQFKGVRTTRATIRLETNDNTIIETAKPIYEMGIKEQLIWLYEGREYDITPYVYSLAEYNNLSSYGGSYPYNKAYALYYVPGEKNIRGLFFTNPNAINNYFSKWAINNILTAVLGGRTMNMTTVAEVANLKFQVRYVPYNKERIRTTKPIVKMGLPRTMAYNQGANAVETRFYGEHLKGLITRLGNVEKSVTYLFGYLTEIPKVGLKYDDTYYISAVTTEVLPTCFKCTLALTKHFNRQSEYVGLNSEKRMWEVSEKQATERESVITDYVKIYEVGLSEISQVSNDDNVLLNTAVQPYIMKELLNLDAYREQNSTRKPISAATIKPFSKNGLEIAIDNFIILPVTSTAYGNSIVFSFDLEDNYSAGQYIKQDGASYYSDYVAYTDNYGRFYSLYMTLADSGSVGDPKTLPLSSAEMPNPLFVAGNATNNNSNTAICYQKDNREVPAISYELQFVSDGSVIIGSALASNSKLVNYNSSKIMFVLLDKEISLLENKNFIDGHLVQIPTFGADMIPIDNLPLRDAYIQLPNVSSANHKAWAFITEPTTTEITVADEDGNTVTQTIYEGGELVLGQNKKSQGQCIAFQMLADIYKKF